MTSHKAIVSGINGRYGLALFELAKSSQALEAVESDLIKLKASLSESADLNDLVSSPLYSRSQQQGAVAKLADVGGAHDLTAKFLGTLAMNRRLAHLPGIIKAFEALTSHDRGEMNAEVVSASQLTTDQLDELKKKLKSAIGQDVSIDASVDESLLGGLKVKVGSRMVDSSVKTKLDNLRVAMKGVQ